MRINFVFFVLLIQFLPNANFAQQKNKTGDELNSMLTEQAKNGWSGSVLIARNDTILVEAGFGLADREAKRPQTANTVFSIGSITKQFTAAAILKLESMGKLKMEDKLGKFFPEAPEAMAAITIHQILTHTAGFAAALGDDYDLINAADYAKLVFSTPLIHHPGDMYDYSNVGYSMLGIIVEKASGMPYEKFLRENLWLPAQMNTTGYQLPAYNKSDLSVGYRNGNRWGTAFEKPWMEDGPSWHLRANGGIISTVGDMYKWYQALMKNTDLPKTQTDKMLFPHIAEGPDNLSHYGYGWVVQYVGGHGMFWHNGGNGVYNANMTFIPSSNICVIVSSNSNDKISDDVALHILSILLQKPELMPKEKEFTYLNNPVTNAVYEEIILQGAVDFRKNSKLILSNAGFDFKDDMQLLGVGERLMEIEKWEEGESLYLTYTSLFPNIVVAWNHLGQCKFKLGDLKGAKSAWEHSISLRPNDNPAANWLVEIKY